MDHFKYIYTQRAADYHRMITLEDVEGNLLAALEHVTPLAGRRILDLGTGTGRIPLLLGQQAGQLVGLELHAAMLQENKHHRDRVEGNWGLILGDMRALPMPAGWAEIITAGWAVGHIRGWFDQEWQLQIGRVVSEMHRVIARGGTLFIIETLTTGGLAPAPPSLALAEYYHWLENDWGFARQEISTDYHFASVDQAVAHTEFFFGPTLSAKIRAERWSRLPEWTGVWSKRV